MTTQAKLEQFNFKGQSLVELLGQPAGADDVTIWGGRITETEVVDFLAACNLDGMSYHIWESAHRIEFTQNSLPDNYGLLERGRVFGPGGDLSLRRDGAEFLWHFIGSKTDVSHKDRRGCLTLPVSLIGSKTVALLSDESRRKYKPQDFWDNNADLKLRRREETALLWGEYKETGEEAGRWQEDRVGWAELDYPGLAKVAGQRTRIRYEVFTDGGQIAFVWLKGLEAV